LERENLIRALKQVRRNRGAPGIDGMTVDELPGYLKVHWPRIKAELSEGRYRPQAGERVMASLQRFIERTLRLRVNVEKSAVDRPWKRHFLGFTFSRRGAKVKVVEKAIDRLKANIRVLSRRTRGHRLSRIIRELNDTLLGWKAYFDLAEVLSPLRDLDKWLRGRLRSYQWKQWGRAGYRQLRKRGVSRELAWNTAKSAHGPWRISHSPALYQAMPTRYFRDLGLPELAAR
jgi:hypothetical protein